MMLSTRSTLAAVPSICLLVLLFTQHGSYSDGLSSWSESHITWLQKDAHSTCEQRNTTSRQTTRPVDQKVAASTSTRTGSAISYDLSTPPTTGCEEIVSRLQLRLIQAYTKMLKGIRYANIWGYLETENKGDAAIWTAQQMLLATLGIESGESCRYLDWGCDADKFNATLVAHEPYSAIIMAGGGNFNDYYWDDQPARLRMVKTFPNVTMRAFPQSVHMTGEDHIQWTQEAFGKHSNVILSARDTPSWRWLDENLDKPHGVPSVLVPDVAFMWGNRPDLRKDTLKAYDVLILARQDPEVAAGDSKDIPWGTGFLDLGGSVGNVSYLKVDWEFTHTPGLDTSIDGVMDPKMLQTVPPLKPASHSQERQSQDQSADIFGKLDFGTDAQQHHGADLMSKEWAPHREESTNARAWAKSMAGFSLLGSARFVITDRLHGHIMSTLIGTPHVLMDSKLGKNLAFHDTWTKDCDCVRIAEDIHQAQDVARRYFEVNPKNE